MRIKGRIKTKVRKNKSKYQGKKERSFLSDVRLIINKGVTQAVSISA